MATPFKLRNGMLLLSTEAPGGIYNAAQLKKIAQLCDGDAALVKATEDQRLALFVAPEKANEVAAALRATGLGLRNYQDGLHQPVNCIGELCSDFQQDAMGLSMELSQELAKISLSSPLKIGINGCARCCVPTHTLDISVIGEANGYRISLGGKNSQIPEMASFMAEGVPPEKLPHLLVSVVTLYKELSEPGESLQDVLERCGVSPFVDALSPYSADAAGNSDLSGSDASALVEEANLDIGSESDLEAAAADDEGLPGGGGDLDLEAVALDDQELSVDGDLPIADEDAGFGEADLEASSTASDDSTAEILVDDEPQDDDLAQEELADEDDMTVDDQLAAGDLELDGQELAVDGLDPDDMAEETLTIPVASTSAAIEDEIPLDASLDFDAPMDDIAIDSELGAGDLPGDLAPFADDDAITDDREALQELSDLPPVHTPANPPSPSAEAVAPKSSVHAASAAVETIGSEDDADLAAAIEVDGDDADAFEAKLEESIADEENHAPVEDENSADRLAAMQLVESAAELPSVAAVEANLGVSDSFDNLEIESDADISDGGALDVNAEVDDSFEPEEIGLDEQAEVTPIRLPAKPQARPNQALDFNGIDVGEGGRLTLSFAGGATMVLDPKTMTPGLSREFTISGKKLLITQGSAGLCVVMDGVEFNLPSAA